MSKTKRLRQHMLLLSKQYDTLSMVMRGETDALIEGDYATSLLLKKKAIEQFVELGKQLKILAREIG